MKLLSHADQLGRVDRLVAMHLNLVDLADHIHALHHFTEDCVFSSPAHSRPGRNEELATPRIRRTGVGKRQSARARKRQPGHNLVLDGETAIVRRAAVGSSTLDRLSGQYAIKSRIVVEWPFDHGVGLRVARRQRALRQLDKHPYAVRRIFFEELGRKLSKLGIENGI
jgi:hypothetical protein